MPGIKLIPLVLVWEGYSLIFESCGGESFQFDDEYFFKCVCSCCGLSFRILFS